MKQSRMKQTMILFCSLFVLTMMLTGCGVHEETCKHDWMEATCTQPRICKICGLTTASPLGHKWAPADCTHARTCTVCGTTEGTPLGHEWNAEGVCERCGEVDQQYAVQKETESQELSGDGEYVPFLECYWGDMTISRDNTVGTPLFFEERVENCKQATIHFQFEKVIYGKVYGEVHFFALVDGYDWRKIGEMEVNDMEEHSVTLTFDEPISFDAIYAAIPRSGQYRYQDMYYMTDFYF